MIKLSFFERIFNFFKKLFRNDNSIKMIEEPKIKQEVQAQKNNFKDSIKVQLIEKKKKKNKIETLICAGDGLRNKKKNDILICLQNEITFEKAFVYQSG